MKRTLRRGFPIVVLAALIVAGVLLATRPWSTEEAAGGTIQYRVCDTVIEGPLPHGPPSQGSIDIVQLIGTYDYDPPSLDVRVMGESGSRVVIDPTSAAVETAGVPDPRLQPVLDTLRIEPLDPSTAPWPYTDATQKPPVYVTGQETFDYRSPDPGSGLDVSMTYNLTTDGSLWHVLHLANCRSSMNIDARFRPDTEPKVTVTKDLHPDDEAAFQAFYEEVTIKEPKRW